MRDTLTLWCIKLARKLTTNDFVDVRLSGAQDWQEYQCDWGKDKHYLPTKTDITKCPVCKGDADNGFDREHPPNPYVCTKCEGEK